MLIDLISGPEWAFVYKPINVVIFICAIVASITYKYYKQTPTRIFMPFLWFVVFIEIINEIDEVYHFFPDSALILFLKQFMPDSMLSSDVWIKSIYSVISFYFYLYYYRCLSTTIMGKRFHDLLLFIYTVSVGLSFLHFRALMFDNWLQIHMYVGVLLTLIAICNYMLTMLYSDRIMKFYTFLPFWISVGLLFFNLTTIPIFIFNSKDSVYNLILNVFNILMYGLFILGFIINEYKVRKDSV